MKKYQRSVNKNLLKSLIYFNGFNFEQIGKLCDPPVSKAAISMLVNEKYMSDRLIKQVSEIFHLPDLILFPYVPVQDTEPSSQEKSKYFGGI
jgi:hypothetical protein